MGRLIRKGAKVAIAVDDLTRLTPCRSVLPVVVDELIEAGVREGDISVIVALGTHRPMSEEEMIARYGEGIMRRIGVVNHDARDARKLVNVGETPSGTPIIVNKEFYESGLRIAIGNVVPHMYAGWSGGAKAVQPGVSSEATTDRTHIAAARLPLEDVVGNVENPIRHEMESVARKTGLNFIVNTVLNENGDLVRAFGGDMVSAHREAVELAKTIFCPRIPAPADVVIASSYPADIDYWQAIKGAVAAFLAVKRGGVIVLVTPCREGIAVPHPEVERYGSLQSHEVEELIRNGTMRDLAAAACILVQSRIRAKARLMIVSEGLSRRDCESIGAEKMGAVDEAVEEAERALGKRASYGVLTCSELAPVVAPSIS